MSKLHILVVEDDPATLESIERFLRDSGYAVSGFADAESAEKALDRRAFAAVVADYDLPGMDGIELVRLAKQFAAAIPCMVVTGHGEIRTAVEAMQAGAFNFLEKPVNLDVLEGLIREACDKHALAIEVQNLRRQLSDKYGLENIIGSCESIGLVALAQSEWSL